MSERTRPIVTIEGLNVWLGSERNHVVRGLDLEVFPGEILAIAGESGAGKTQAAASMIGLAGRGRDAVADGRISFADESIDAGDFDRLARFRGRISMVVQESMASITPVRRIGDLLHETLATVGPEVGAPGAEELLAEVGFEDPAAVLPCFAHELSGGMRQRVAFALALASSPQILIADEPTTALDLRLQAGVMSLISRLRASRGMSIVLITHDLAVIAQLADRTLIMRDGAAVECDGTERLFADPSDPYTAELLSLNRDRRQLGAPA